MSCGGFGSRGLHAHGDILIDHLLDQGDHFGLLGQTRFVINRAEWNRKVHIDQLLGQIRRNSCGVNGALGGRHVNLCGQSQELGIQGGVQLLEDGCGVGHIFLHARGSTGQAQVGQLQVARVQLRDEGGENVLDGGMDDRSDAADVCGALFDDIFQAGQRCVEAVHNSGEQIEQEGGSRFISSIHQHVEGGSDGKEDRVIHSLIDNTVHQGVQRGRKIRNHGQNLSARGVDFGADDLGEAIGHIGNGIVDSIQDAAEQVDEYSRGRGSRGTL